jgi:hypothetical protein
MKLNSIQVAANRGEVHDFVMGLWSDGPIRQSHEDGGLIHQIVDKFARLPRIFFEPSDVKEEWTHFSPWWGAILLCQYANPTIRDLRYLHEIYHAATMPYARNMNLATMTVRNHQNEREASTFTEMAIYLELPELRQLSFPHPIFADRFIFPSGDYGRPDARLLQRWRTQPDAVFQEMMYARLQVVLADDDQVDPNDPQTIWLRRYPEQGEIWTRTWAQRHRLVDDAMITLRERCETEGRRSAGDRHVDWLLSQEVTDGTDIPFYREATQFRRTFDELVAAYDSAMEKADQVSVKPVTG